MQVIYIGESCERTIGKRLYDFDRSAFQAKNGHSAGWTYAEKFGDEGQSLFVSVLPVELQEPGSSAFIRYAERKLIWEYVRLRGEMPRWQQEINSMTDIVQKLWGFCHTLRHDGIDYGDYIEQITFLLFLKMADEKAIELPKTCDWPTLRDKNGTDLTDHYSDTLRKLSRSEGMLGDIYAEAQSRFNNPVNLKRLINLVDETEWTSLGVDVKAQAYEGLLEKAASEGKKGAGQYFTPRVLIQSIVQCMKPDPRIRADFTVCDPACGTGGFLVSAYEWLIGQSKGGALDRDIVKRIRKSTYFGQELVARPRRMALMNLFLTASNRSSRSPTRFTNRRAADAST